MTQQPLFGGYASAKTCEVAGSAHHSMTGNDYGQRIGTIGCTDCPAGSRFTKKPGYFTVAACVVIGDLFQRLPDAELERCALGRERE